ncbi:MAG: hypothetical protein CMQ38_09500 [Gammaproteobacteria bacterium]|mgnify:CR=1 FL=1|nr:hypothetical protein [Gammaproteobacteria bacterium]
MKNFDTRVYSIGDFLEWSTNGLLELSPDFQRRGVWTKQAKSYLMDTVITGKPMPKILMSQRMSSSRNTRVIIDGQQRLRAIIEYCTDDFAISKAHNEEYGGVKFSNLPSEIKADIYKYEIGVDVLFDMSYEETLDIFARLNTYSVRLNKQELFNAKYLGPFKQSAYKIGYRYVKYWVDSGVLTKAKVTRMGEAELASDILAAAIEGIQSNKTIEKIYSKYEDEDADIRKYVQQSINVMDFILELYPAEELKQTNFRRVHIFYSLFCAIYHSMFGIVNLEADRLSGLRKKTGTVKVSLDDFSAKYDEETESLEKFIDASRRATTDTANRIYRAKVLSNVIAES